MGKKFQFDDELDTPVCSSHNYPKSKPNIINQENHEFNLNLNKGLHLKSCFKMMNGEFVKKNNQTRKIGYLNCEMIWTYSKRFKNFITTVIILFILFFALTYFNNNISSTTTSNWKVVSVSNENGFIFNDSDMLLIKEADINYFKDNYQSEFSKIIQWSINEIYARNGYVFESDLCNNYFKQFEWYQPTNKIQKDEFYNSFNYYEKENIRLLLKYRS